MTTKPCRLEINNSGAWKVIGRFDAADEDEADGILNAAEALARELWCCTGNARQSWRVSMDDGHGAVLMRLHQDDPTWRDAVTQEAC